MKLKIRTYFDNNLLSASDVKSLCIKNISVDKIVNDIAKTGNKDFLYGNIKTREL